MSIAYLIVILAIIAIVWVIADWLKVPEPINRIVKIVLVVAVVIVLINFLFALTGHGGFIRFDR